MQLGNSLVPVTYFPQPSFRVQQVQAAQLLAEKKDTGNIPSIRLNASLVAGLFPNNTAGLFGDSVNVMPKNSLSGFVLKSSVSMTAKQAIASYISNTSSDNGGNLQRTGGIDIFA